MWGSEFLISDFLNAGTYCIQIYDVKIMFSAILWTWLKMPFLQRSFWRYVTEYIIDSSFFLNIFEYNNREHGNGERNGNGIFNFLKIQ